MISDLDSLSLHEPIFKDVKYFVTGDVPDKVIYLLQSGGAENIKYLSDYVTHLICGNNAADTDIEEAQEIYQIPAVTVQWVVASIRLKKLANSKAYSPNKNKIFTNVLACLSKVTPNDAKLLYALITYHGGKVKLNFNSKCTHLICGSASGKRYQVALTLSGRLKIVTPDWVIESLRARIQAVTEVFHPKLLIVPQLPKSIDPRISAITGFDFEEGIAKNEVPTQNMSETKDDNTQALLDKLKQRMPWNHPPSAPNTSNVTPIATTMGFTNSPTSTANIMSKSIPQGIVTQNIHSVSNQQMMQKFVQNTIASSQQGLNNQQHMQNQVINQVNQVPQQQPMSQNQVQQPHGMTAIHIQQQKLIQQHSLRMQMLQQQKHPNQQQQQSFQAPTNTSLPQMTQGHPQMQQHIQSNQHHLQPTQSISQSPSTTLTQAQQIENISQMLSQSANNLQQSQLNQQMKQGLTPSQQTAVQNIAQQLAQSTQNLQQSLQNAKMNQGLTQGQINQQILGGNQTMTSQQNLIQQQTVQSLVSQQQNINLNVVNQQGLVTSAQSQGQHQVVGATGQQTVLGQQIQNVQQTIQSPQGGVPVQNTWRQQNIQMVQNINQGQHIIRSPLIQSRNPQNQVILQQQIMQTQQQSLLSNQQPQSGQHVQQTSQQILQQTIGAQGSTINQTHHQILVQKQQILNGAGQQQIVQAPQQVLINQHTGQQQILVHGNQQVTIQGGQQIVSQSQIVHQGGQLVTQGGQQVLTSGTQQVLTQGGQHVITQQGAQHQVVIAQSSQQIVNQPGQQIIGQTQQVLSQSPGAGGGIQQIITHGGNQQIVSPGGQQLVQGGQNVTWQQQQYLQRQQINQAATVGPRVSWTAGGGGRQLIHLDAQTHAQLQQMDPQQRAMFVAQLQKRRQLSMQRAAAMAQQQAQAGGVPAPAVTQSVTFIRGQLPPGLTQQQQVQWLQQQGARATTIPAAAPVQPPQSPVAGTPSGGAVGQVGGQQVVGSPGGGGGTPTDSQLQQLQMQRQQQYQRLQQLHAQRDHVVHHHATVKAQQVAPGVTQHVVSGAAIPEQAVEAGLLAADQHQGAGGALLVNPKTKTALANMLSIRLQGNVPPSEHEPSAAGTLRLMTAAHAAVGAAGAAGAVRPPPTRLLLGSTPMHPHHHPHQAAASASPVPGKVYTGPVRAPPPRAQFYGHNPNLKLPPDLFLLGCVFHIVEYQQSWGAERVTRWSELIQRRGGEVEHNYCARVTHLLCETQKHGVVMQALRDAKRCVTAYWLSDTIQRRAVAPPWQAIHLPTMYAARDTPARHHRAAISGWRGEERDRITFMIEHVGAKLTPYMSRDNTVLICKRPDGNKYRRARDLSIPVVTAAWLTDLLLGNMSALSQVNRPSRDGGVVILDIKIDNAKYQQFNLGSPFRMDYNLVSHLMNAWKMPINITQESHERAKRSALTSSGRRAKRPRLEPEPLPPTTAPAPPPPPLHLAPRVLFSAVTTHEQNKLANIVRQLGGLVVTTAKEATHLIMDRLVRTTKLVACLVTVKHLLTPEWLLESQRINKFADEAKHGLRDESFNRMFNCDISEVLLCGEQRKKLFEGVTFFLTPCVKPSKVVLVEMIELCGGKVEKNRRSYVSIQEIHNQRPYSYLVLTVPNDLHLVYYLLQSEKTLNVVCSTEVVLSAIMRQRLEVHDFLVKID